MSCDRAIYSEISSRIAEGLLMKKRLMQQARKKLESTKADRISLINDLASGTTRERSDSGSKSNQTKFANACIDESPQGCVFNFAKNIVTCEDGMSPSIKVGVLHG